MKESPFGIRRGVNLGGWLSQCDYSAERMDNFIKAEDFAVIASWNADHVRIPVDYNVLEDECGGFDAPGWRYIDFALAECEKHGLKTVIDLHKTAGYTFNAEYNESGFFESEKYQQRFYRLWEEMARRYGVYSNRVIFELLNEITEADYIDNWNRISYECIRRVRAMAPDTYILVGSYDYNSAPALKYLAPPADDRVVYNFHCYDPKYYTHQGASWMPELKDSPFVPFDDIDDCVGYLETQFVPAIEAAEKNGSPLYCGEYGVISTVPPADAVKWVRAINSLFEKYGIARAIWTYREMDFGISDARWDACREELIKVL